MEKETKAQLTNNLIVLGATAVLMAGFVLAYLALAPKLLASGKARMLEGPMVPPVGGWAEGREIQFIHTETSDPEISKVLTEMMDSPVLTVPELADTPDELLAAVYVFTNGVEGPGPLGFQPDVFDSPPGTPGYRPMRAVHLVTWANERDARLLQSAAKVRELAAAGKLEIERPGVVVNMPFVSWPGGER